MAWIVPAVTAAASAVGIAQGVKALTAKSASPYIGGKAIEPLKPETEPDVTAESVAKTAEESATAKLKKRLRISALTGGKTNLTRGKALIPEDMIQKKALLGV